MSVSERIGLKHIKEESHFRERHDEARGTYLYPFVEITVLGTGLENDVGFSHNTLGGVATMESGTTSVALLVIDG